MPFSEKELHAVLDACNIQITSIDRDSTIPTRYCSESEDKETDACCFYTTKGRIFLAKDEEIARVSPFKNDGGYRKDGRIPYMGYILKSEVCLRGTIKYDRLIYDERHLVWLLLRLRKLYTYNASQHKTRRHLRKNRYSILEELAKKSCQETFPNAKVYKTTTNAVILHSNVARCKVGIAKDGTFSFSMSIPKEWKGLSEDDIYMAMRFVKNFIDEMEAPSQTPSDRTPDKDELDSIYRHGDRNPEDDKPHKQNQQQEHNTKTKE